MMVVIFYDDIDKSQLYLFLTCINSLFLSESKLLLDIVLIFGINYIMNITIIIIYVLHTIHIIQLLLLYICMDL